MTHSYSSHIHTARIMLAVLLLTGAAGISVQAEQVESTGGGTPRTTPLTVTEKNQIVSGDFNVTVTDGRHDAALDIPATASGGTVQVKSNEIKGNFTQPADEEIMEANGVYIHGDYTGTVHFADGLQVSTSATGKDFNADCIYLTGVENSYDSKGNLTKEKTDKANEAYGKSGKIADAYGIVGKNTTLSLTGKPVDGEWLNLVGLESHFAHMNVGDGLNVSVTTGPVTNLYVSGLDVMYYGQMELGSGNTIKVQAGTGDTANVVDLDGIYSSHDHPSQFEEQLPVLGRQKLDVGDDTNLIVDCTSSPENTGYVQNTGAFLSDTDFTFGNRLNIQNTMKGSGVLGDTGSILEGIYAQSSDGHIGQDFTDNVTFSNGQISRLRGVTVYGVGKQSSLAIGDHSQVNLTVNQGNVSAETEGYLALNQGKISTGNHAHTSITIKNSTLQGKIDGLDALDQSSIQMGDDAQVSIDADKTSTLQDMVMGLNAQNQSFIHMGNNAQVAIDAAEGSMVKDGIYGVYLNNYSSFDTGDRYTSHIVAADNQVGMELLGDFGYSTVSMGNDAKETLSLSTTTHSVFGHDVNDYSTLTMGDRSDLSMQIHGVKIDGEGNMARQAMVGNTINNQSKVTYGDEGKQSLMMDGIAGAVYGNQVRNQSALTIGNGQTNTISVQGIAGSVVGNDVIQSNLTVGKDLKNIITVSGKDAAAYTIAGDELAAAPADGVNLKTSSGYTTIIRAEGNNGNSNGVNGMFAVSGAKASIGDGAVIDIQDRYTGTQNTSLYGIRNQDAEVTYGSHLRENLTGVNTGSVYGIYTAGSQGKTQVGDDALLQVNASGQNTYGVCAQAGGQVGFSGGAVIQMGQDQDAIYSTGSGSSVTAMSAGRKVILGNLEAADGGAIKLNLNTADSYFRGQSTVDGADTELTLSNGACWDMTDSSTVTKLDHDNGGTVNMQYNPEYQRLDVGTYSGQNGIFRMKTDLDSETNGDKVYMTRAAAGAHGIVQVQDESFLTNHEVTGTKHLLLITDASKNATFSGQSIDEGGLWDVTPTIQNGKYVREVMGDADAKDTEWYLTKLTKSVNADTKPLLGAVDYGYGLYRNSIDTLRQRMGDLRFLKNKRDAAGIWARSYGGELDGPGYDSKYHAIQVGYDYAANDKSLYGFLGERGIASPHYDYGSSKDHSLAGAIYGTWFGDSGSYTDVVAKWGRDDSNLHTYGPYADSANFRTSSESLSVEYGKTTKLNGHGLFIEPQVQLVLGRLNDKDFTTARGKTVHLGSYDSAIGRLGFVFGQRRPDAAKPYDYYLKASVLHEFGGDRSFHLAAPDGETMDLTNHYGSTWYEAGFGGTYRVNNSTYLYADAERSFGSDWHKKWQANVGINWQF